MNELELLNDALNRMGEQPSHNLPTAAASVQSCVYNQAQRLKDAEAENQRLRCESFRDAKHERLFKGSAAEYLRMRAGKFRDRHGDPKQAARLFNLAEGVDALEAENRRLRGVSRIALQLKRLEVENRRLREALYGIGNTPPTDLAMVRSEAYWSQLVRDMQNQAREALSQEVHKVLVEAHALDAENRRLRDALRNLLEWAEPEAVNYPGAGNIDDAWDLDIMPKELKAAREILSKTEDENG